MRRLLVAAAVVVSFAGVASQTIAGPTSRAVLTGCDALVPAGVPWTIRFKVERDSYSRYDLRNVRVELWANGARIGTAVSGYDGYASFQLATPSSAGDLVVTGRLAAGGYYTASDETLLVSVRNKSQRIVVTDIDSTISDASWSEVTHKSNDQLPPLAGAVRGVNDLAQGATIVYLTAREDNYRAKTRDWLDRYGFPRGPVFCSDGDKSMSTQAYKTAVLRTLVPYFTNVVAGIGNKSTDAKAYDANGIPSAMFDTQGGSFPSFAIVKHGWDELRAANAAGKVPFLAWSTSFR